MVTLLVVCVFVFVVAWPISLISYFIVAPAISQLHNWLKCRHSRRYDMADSMASSNATASALMCESGQSQTTTASTTAYTSSTIDDCSISISTARNLSVINPTLTIDSSICNFLLPASLFRSYMSNSSSFSAQSVISSMDTSLTNSLPGIGSDIEDVCVSVSVVDESTEKLLKECLAARLVTPADQSYWSSTVTGRRQPEDRPPDYDTAVIRKHIHGLPDYEQSALFD